MLHSVWFGDSGMIQLPVSPGCPRNPSCSLSPRTQQRVRYQHILRLTCSYFLCLTFIRETELYPLDNLYTAAVFSVRVTQDTLELFVSLAELRASGSNPVLLSHLQVLSFPRFNSAILLAEGKPSQLWGARKLPLHGMESTVGWDQPGKGCTASALQLVLSEIWREAVPKGNMIPERVAVWYYWKGMYWMLERGMSWCPHVKILLIWAMFVFKGPDGLFSGFLTPHSVHSFLLSFYAFSQPGHTSETFHSLSQPCWDSVRHISCPYQPENSRPVP